MEHFKGIPGSQPHPIPIRPAKSVPIIQTKLVPGVDYEIKSFGNRDQAKKRMMADIMARHPHLSQKDASSIANTTAESHFSIIGDDKKNKNYLASMDVPLPEGTEWKDIKILIDKFDVKHPARSIIRILLKGKSYRTTNFHEMHLDNTKEEKISDGGKILYFMSLGSRLTWNEDGGIPVAQRKIKERLSQDLRDFFGLTIDPFVLENKEYKLLIELSTRDKITLQERYPKFLGKSAFELLNDTPIFS